VEFLPTLGADHTTRAARIVRVEDAPAGDDLAS
jgi:hypothetical protein